MTRAHNLANAQKSVSPVALFRSISLHEWVTVAVLAVAFGVAYAGWTYVYEALKNPILKPLNIKRALDGFWLMAPVFLGYLIRKPGIALFGSIVAATVEGLLTRWGAGAIIYGFLQGLGAEIIFAGFLYRYWHYTVALIASTLAAILSFVYDFYSQDQANLSTWFNATQFIVFIISSWIFSGMLSIFLAKRLLKTGLLDHFLVSNQHSH